jgi:hypothetical protein
VIGVKAAFDFSGFAGGYGVFKFVEAAEVFRLNALRDLSHPFAIKPVPHDPDNPARIVRWPTQISIVLGHRDGAKIFQTVVKLIAVDVVNRIVSPLTGSQKPNHTMCEIRSVENSTASIAVARKSGKRFLARKLSVPDTGPMQRRLTGAAKHLDRPRLPKQLPGVEINVEKWKNFCKCQVSHSIAPRSLR